jgi:hypothetical protein
MKKIGIVIILVVCIYFIEKKVRFENIEYVDQDVLVDSMTRKQELFVKMGIHDTVMSKKIEKGGVWLTFKNFDNLLYVFAVNEGYEEASQYFFSRAVRFGGVIIKKPESLDFKYVTEVGDTLKYSLDPIPSK